MTHISIDSWKAKTIKENLRESQTNLAMTLKKSEMINRQQQQQCRIIPEKIKLGNFCGRAKKEVRCAWNTNCLWWTNKLFSPLHTHTHTHRFIYYRTVNWTVGYLKLCECFCGRICEKKTLRRKKGENSCLVNCIFSSQLGHKKRWLINVFSSEFTPF